jgi:YfiH family protein
MPLRETEGLSFFQFNQLLGYPLTQAVFTRHGGVSPTPWSSLNVGGTVGDDPARVHENRRRLFHAVGLSPESLFDVWQIHSARVVYATSPRGEGALEQADIMITDCPGVALFMRFADCVPIYLYDPKTPAIGIAHAGWLGTVRRAAEMAVQAMATTFGSEPQNILAGIGPSIGPDHYEVGEDVTRQFEASFGMDAASFISSHNGSSYLDLWAANRYLLEGQGLSKIETAEICTVCHQEDWFSHRGEDGRTGRFGAVLGLIKE